VKRTQNSLSHNEKNCSEDSKVRDFNSAVLPEILPYLECILTDGYNLLKEYGFTDYTRDMESLRRRYTSQGVGFIQRSLPGLFDSLTRHLETGVSDYPEFCLQRGTSHPRFLRKLFVLIFSDHASIRVQALAFQIIYQLCAAFKKLEGPYSQNVLRKELADFVKTDESLGKLNFREPNVAIILKHAQAVVGQLFSNYKGDDPHELPCPGSGATCVPVGKDLRYRPHFLYSQLHDVYDHDIWFNTFYQYIFGGDEVEYAQRLQELMEFATYPTSRFKYIFKKLGKPRGICIEENEAQFFQQCLRRFLYWFIESHPRTKGRVNFTDQSINQWLALSSSLDRMYATIDMSEASDRVDRELTLIIFLLTNLFDKLEAVSTKMIQLPVGLGQTPILKANKFAPMGSGVCFPIMSIVHWSLIVGIIACSSLPNASLLCKEVFVYGDDIIVPKQCAELVYKYLPKFGMKINVEKSYVNSYFRESCGCHAYKGIDITPTFFKKLISNTTQSSDSTTLISLISKEYRLVKNGFNTTAKYLRRTVHRLYGDLPIVNVDSDIVGWKTDEYVPPEKLMPFCKGVKVDREDPQQRLYKFRIARAATTELPVLDEGRGYFRKATTLTEDSRTVMGEPEDLRVFWSWVPEPTLSSDNGRIAEEFTRKTVEVYRDSRFAQLRNYAVGTIALSYSPMKM
jgi:hypothetical protein